MTVLLPTQQLNLSDRGGMSHAQSGNGRLTGTAVDPRIPFLVKPNQIRTRVLPLIEAFEAFQERVKQRKLEGIQNEVKNDFTEKANNLLADYREKKLKGAVNAHDNYNAQLDSLKEEYSSIFENHRDFKESTDKWLNNHVTSYKSTGYDHYSNEVFKQNNLQLQARITNTNIAFQNNATSPQAQLFYEEYQDANKRFLEFNGYDLNSEEAQVALTKANDDAITQVIDYNCDAEQYGIASNRLETFKNTINGTTYRELALKIKDGLERQAKKAEYERSLRQPKADLKPMNAEQKVAYQQERVQYWNDRVSTALKNPKNEEYERFSVMTPEQRTQFIIKNANKDVMQKQNALMAVNKETSDISNYIDSVYGSMPVEKLSTITSDNALSFIDEGTIQTMLPRFDYDRKRLNDFVLSRVDNLRGGVGFNSLKNLKAMPKRQAYYIIHDPSEMAKYPISLKDESDFNKFKSELEELNASGKLGVEDQTSKDLIENQLVEDFGKKKDLLADLGMQNYRALITDKINQRIYNTQKITGKPVSANEQFAITTRFLLSTEYKELKKQAERTEDKIRSATSTLDDQDLLKDDASEDEVNGWLFELNAQYQRMYGYEPSENELVNFAITTNNEYLSNTSRKLKDIVLEREKKEKEDKAERMQSGFSSRYFR